jgi:uncharacterized membrane protein YecN with MAPEG domain
MHPLVLPVIAALTAGILIILQMALMITVIPLRRKNRQSLSHGGHSDLLQAIRRHGNFAENAAIFVTGLALLELMGTGRIEIGVMSAVFILGRVSHAIGLTIQPTVNVFRFIGIASTTLVNVALGGHLVAIALANL